MEKKDISTRFNDYLEFVVFLTTKARITRYPDPLPTSPILKCKNGGGEGVIGGWRGIKVLTADHCFTVRAKHPTAKF